MHGLVVCLLYTERISSRYQALNARLAGETRASFVNMPEAHHKNRPFPSSLHSLFQSESKCEIFVMIISSNFNMNEN